MMMNHLIDKDRVSVQARVYRILRNSILRLHLKPGTVMSTQEVANKLSVSRTPVREAFIRLEREGLVDIFPQKETTVSLIDLKRVAQERFIRENLECAAVEAIIKNCNCKNIALLYESIGKQQVACKERNYVAHVSFDNDFHKLLFSIADLLLCWEMIEGISSNYVRIRLMAVWAPNIMEAVIEQHKQLLATIEKGDAEAAREHMRTHVRMLDNEKEVLLHQYPDFFKSVENETPLSFDTLLSV